MSEYELTEEEAEKICEYLKDFEKNKRYFL